MRHQNFGKKLNRDIKERKSLFRNLVGSLILYGKITTSTAKAKAIRGLVDKLVIKAKEGTLSARRQVAGFLQHRDEVKKLVDVIAPKFEGRSSGFTRIIKGEVRKGDASPIAVMEWVEEVDKKKEETKKEELPKTDKKTPKVQQKSK